MSGSAYSSLAAVYDRLNARIFNEEMVQTIDKFFECHLNVSEAARQLYIHRNTLVYRLDKVQRATGLDLRAFDDAITFKMLRMLGRVNDGQKQRKGESVQRRYSADHGYLAGSKARQL